MGKWVVQLRERATSLRSWLGWGALGAALIVFLAITVRLNLTTRGEEHFSLLAQSFLHGNLAFDGPPDGTWGDTTPYQGKHYWPLGPFPAVLLMPFQFLAGLAGIFFYQGYLQIVLVGALLALVFLTARRTGFDLEDSAYLAFGFTFSTTCLGVAIWPWSWYFSQTITCVLIFAAIAEMTGKRRPFLIGIAFALCLVTRATAALGLLWFACEVVFANQPAKEKMRSLAASILPCLIVLGLLFLYNQARFGSILEQGYADQIVGDRADARNVGIFSIHHVPANLYTLLLAGPVPITSDSTFVLTFPFVAANPWGMSLFVTAPCLFLLAGLSYRDTTSRLILLTTVLIALPILFYYGIGYRQFGYRYALDFLPLLYYLLFRNYRAQRGELTPLFKMSILFAAVWNLHLFAGHFLWHLT
jgi:hypothetical protein